jgi:hypothetical protein
VYLLITFLTVEGLIPSKSEIALNE